jgi:translation initiation factor 3 subunit D
MYLLLYSYVSRASPRDSTKHVILGTVQYKPHEFATNITLDLINAWGVLKCIIDTCMAKPAGRYLIMKDPEKVTCDYERQ